MSKKRTLIILGLTIALIPFLGLPRAFREILIVLLGLLVASLSFLLRRKLIREMEEKSADTFTQNNFSGGPSEKKFDQGVKV